MGIVKVWNDNTYPYRENFRGTEIYIPAKDYVKMEYDQAIIFKGTMGQNMKVDSNNHGLPESYKMIRIDMDPHDVPKEEKFVSPVTGKKYMTQAELEKDLEQHSDKLLDPKEAMEAKRVTRKRATKKASE